MSEHNLEISLIRIFRCVICFSQDRKLFVTKNHTFMATFCPEISFKSDDRVCWECEYIIRKMIKFKQKAIMTQKLLIKWAKGEHLPTNSLSALNNTDLVNISYLPDQGDCPDIKDTIIDKPEIFLSDIKDNVDDGTKIIKTEVDSIKIEYENYFDEYERTSCDYDANAEDRLVVTKIEEVHEDNCLDNTDYTVEVESEIIPTKKDLLQPLRPPTPMLKLPPVRIAALQRRARNNAQETPESEKTENTKEESPMKLYNALREPIATVEKMGEEKMKEFMDKERAKADFLAHKWKCMTCIQKFAVSRFYEDHNMMKHSTVSGHFKCGICEQRFMFQQLLDSHQQEHYICYKCVVCGEEFRTQKEIQYHYYQLHTKHATPKTPVKERRFIRTRLPDHRLFECKICQKTFKGEMGLGIHYKRTHNIKNNETAYCAECNIHFKRVHAYKQHLLRALKHRTEEAFRYTCDTCGAKYVYKGDLANHINRVHLKTEKHRCKKCSKLFRNDYQLRRHFTEVHEKQRPPRNQICNYCGRLFTTLAILRCHIRTHTGERPLKCKSCPATFAHPAALYTHNKLVHKPVQT